MSACTGKTDIPLDKIEHHDRLVAINTDRARYAPGEQVHYKLQLQEGGQGGTLHVRYKHLNQLVQSEKLAWRGEPELAWSWQPPAEDYKGYMTEIVLEQSGSYVDHMNIAVDVSSDWGKFPRYGYLADFGVMTQSEQEAVIERLTRFRINGIQFYDWQWKHHRPLKLIDGAPAAQWPDIANRVVSLDTVERYIDLVHSKGMKAMNYNLLFGAYETAEQDGVQLREWGLFQDPLGGNPDHHPLPSSWASDIVLLDPSNEAWQRYLLAAEKTVFEHLAFDGWHVDQLGDRGTLWNSSGERVDLAGSYAPMLEAAHQELGIELVMNAVGQYAQPYIARSPVKFLYTEVWAGHPSYRHLQDIVNQNERFSQGALNTVFAAYMNYNHTDRGGAFNAPGILMTNAVMFALGAAHLELGEHMLAKEYFPHRRLTIPDALEQQLITYYDFLTAYQNVLRDGLDMTEELEISSPRIQLSQTMEQGKVWTLVKRKGRMDIVHLINFSDAVHMNWNDADATQAMPRLIEQIELTVETSRKVSRVWMASPEFNLGSTVELAFKQDGSALNFTLPKLQVWDMVVMEYKN